MTVPESVRRVTIALTATYARGVTTVEHLLDRVPSARRTLTELERVEFINRAMILAAQALLTLVPLLVVLSAFLPHALAAGIATRLQETVGISGPGTAPIRQALTAPQQQIRTQVGVVGLVMTLASTLSFARALQAMFERVWELPRGRGLPAQRGAAMWLLGWLSYLLVVAALARALGLGTAWSPGRLLVQAVTGTAVWLWTAHTLLVGRVAWSELWAGAVITGVATTILSEGSRLVMPRYISSNVAQFGPMGLIFALASWLIAFAGVVVVSTVIGRVLVQDPLVRETSRSVLVAVRRATRRPSSPRPPDPPAPHQTPSRRSSLQGDASPGSGGTLDP